MGARAILKGDGDLPSNCEACPSGCPRGCAVGSADPLARCEAELHGDPCQLCQRAAAAVPALAIEWDGGPGWRVCAHQHVQAINLNLGKGEWAVVVFRWGRAIDDRFPPIVCVGRDRAIDLAFARARQLRPRRAVRPFGRDGGSWSCGGVLVLVADPY